MMTVLVASAIWRSPQPTGNASFAVVVAAGVVVAFAAVVAFAVVAAVAFVVAAVSGAAGLGTLPFATSATAALIDLAAAIPVAVYSSHNVVFLLLQLTCSGRRLSDRLGQLVDHLDQLSCQA